MHVFRHCRKVREACACQTPNFWTHQAITQQGRWLVVPCSAWIRPKHSIGIPDSILWRGFKWAPFHMRSNFCFCTGFKMQGIILPIETLMPAFLLCTLMRVLDTAMPYSEAYPLVKEHLVTRDLCRWLDCHVGVWLLEWYRYDANADRHPPWYFSWAGNAGQSWEDCLSHPSQETQGSSGSQKIHTVTLAFSFVHNWPNTCINATLLHKSPITLSLFVMPWQDAPNVRTATRPSLNSQLRKHIIQNSCSWFDHDLP